MTDENLEIWDRDVEIDHLKDQIAILQDALILDRAKLLDVYRGLMNGIPELHDEQNKARAKKMLVEEYWGLDWFE
jgi:hypothetical protein